LIAHYDFDYATGKKVVTEKFIPVDIQEIYTQVEKYVELLYSAASGK
jgi:hypothetical protein